MDLWWVVPVGSSSMLRKWYNGLGQEDNKRLWDQNQPFPCKDCALTKRGLAPPGTSYIILYPDTS